MRWKVGLPIAAAAAVLAFVVWLNGSWRSPSSVEEAFPLPPFSESPYLNTGPDVRYVGIATCKECHSSKYDSYLHTAHSRALSEVNPRTEPPDGAFEHKASGRTYRVYRQDNQFRHQEVLRTPEGKEIGRVDLPARYLVGSGRFARTYLVESDGFLMESPITWYTSRKSWSMSPGYDKPEHFSFQRSVSADCLACHTGRVEPKSDVGYQVHIAEQRIGCESCHGPGSRHADYHRTNKHPAGEEDLTIVNPGKLPRSSLEAICAVCHLQSAAAAIPVRGRKTNAFRPGRPLTDYRIDYGFASESHQMTVVGHFEQLRQSACYQKSSELSCLTCHNPHLREKPGEQTAYYRQKCLNCHTSQGCSLELTKRLAKDPTDNCTACHMPRGDTEVPHVAFTHHRIGRHPGRTLPVFNGVPDLIPFEDAPLLTAIDRKRNLGLGYLMAAGRSSDKEHASAYHRRARELLDTVYEAGLRDGATLEGLATIHAQVQDYALARSYAWESLRTTDLSNESHLRALQILFESHLHDNEIEDAIGVLEKLTRLRRGSSDWRALGDCYLAMNQPEKALQAFQKALAINPFKDLIHAGLAEVYRRLGDLPRAAEHGEKARALARNAKS